MMAGHTNAFPDLERELRFCPLGVESPGTVSKEQISRYNDQGFLAPVDVFSDREVADIREYFDHLLTRALAAGWTAGELTNFDGTSIAEASTISSPIPASSISWRISWAERSFSGTATFSSSFPVTAIA